MEIYDLISPRKRKEKTHWHNVGKAFSRDSGGFSLSFDALPLPDNEGKVSVLMVAQKPKEENKHIQQSNDFGDEIPF